VIRCLAPTDEVPDVDNREPPSLRPRQLRYPSDLTDTEWQQLKPLIPPAKRGVASDKHAHSDEVGR
jgi:hypothetical protein